MGMRISETARSAVAIAFFRRSGSCLTREKAGIDTLLITFPRSRPGADARLKAST